MTKSTKRLDSLDLKILELLQRDARMTAEAIAAKVGLTASPCIRRIKQLEERGILKGYVAIVDQSNVGLLVSVFLSVKLIRQHEEELEKFATTVNRWPEVMECYLMTGQQDYLIRVVVPDLGSYETFLKAKLTRLENIASIESSFALSQVKYTNVLPLSHM